MKEVEIKQLSAELLAEFRSKNKRFSPFFVDGSINAGPCWAGILADEIVGVGGIVDFWPGVGEAWSCYSEKAIVSCRREVLYYTRRFLELAITANNYHRIQAVMRTDVPPTWAKHLGFAREGLLKGYCADGSDAVMYARRISDES